MNVNKKIGYEDTEEPYDLFKAAQDDIMHICDTIESKRFNPEKSVLTSLDEMTGSVLPLYAFWKFKEWIG